MRDSISGGALTEVSLMILLSLYTPHHGYGIMQFVEEMTEGRLQLGAGTLYGAINTLEEKGWISFYGREGRRNEYLITHEGKQVVQEEKERLKSLLTLLEDITGGKHD